MLTTQGLLIHAAYAVCFALALSVCAMPLLGVLQQEGYAGRSLLRWLFGRGNVTRRRYGVLALVAFLLSATFSLCFCFAGAEIAALIGAVGQLGSYVLFCYAFRKSLKVPVKFTPRLIRLLVAFFLLLFALLYGAAIGLGYAASLSGIALLCAVRLAPLALFAFLFVFALLAANAAMGVYEAPRRRSFIRRAARTLAASPCVKVGVTGSFGKTSVKRIAAHILSAERNVSATPASYNTPIGIARFVNEGGASCEIFLAEMGARKRGDIAELCDMVRPTVGVVVGVCPQHLETFGSLENIRAEKGVLALRAEKTVLGASAAEMRRENSLVEGEDFAAEDVVLSAEGTSFTLRLGDFRAPVHTALLGRHAAQDIAIAAALCYALGMDPARIASAAATVPAVPHRLQRLEGNGAVILDDSYNSNVEGAKDAVEVLKLCGGNRFVVTPGLVELGEIEEKENEALGASFVGLERVVLVGETRILAVRNGYLAAGGDEGALVVVPSLGKARDYLSQTLAAGDAVLFLNDLPDKYI